MSEQERGNLPSQQAPRWLLSALSTEELSRVAQASKDDELLWKWAVSHLSEFSDEALFVIYRIRGDDAFWDAVYHRLRPKVYSLIKRIIRDPARAEDLTQEVMVRILKSEFDPQKGDLLNFALSIARNLALDEFRLRHLSQWRDFVPTDEPPGEEDDESLGASIADPITPQSDEVALAHEQAQAIRHCLDCLGEWDRRLLEMWVDDEAPKEIAAALGWSYTKVTTRKSRALKKLRECYENYQGGQLL